MSVEETSDFPDTFDSALQINSDIETVYGNLGSASDYDFFEIWLNKGDRIVAMTQDNEGGTSSIDTMLGLYDPLGNWVLYSDDFWGSASNLSHLWYEADQPGWWRIAVSGDSGATGDYVLEVFRAPVPEPGVGLLVLMGLGLFVRVAKARRRSK